MTAALKKKYDFDEVFDSQKVFRLILEAFSQPVRMVSIQEYASRLYGEHSSMLALAVVLLDNEVSFNTGENRQLSDEIVSLTHAKRTLAEEADFVLVCNAEDIETVIGNVKSGTLVDPHKSATIVIRDVQEPTTTLHKLTFSGPGINGAVTTWVTQTVLDTIVQRDAQYFEYPQGIDLLFVTDEGGLLAIPRLVQKVQTPPMRLFAFEGTD